MSINIISNTGKLFPIKKDHLQKFDYFTNTFTNLDTITEISYADPLYSDDVTSIFIKCLKGKFDPTMKKIDSLQQIVDTLIVIDFHTITDEDILTFLYDCLFYRITKNKPFGKIMIPKAIVGLYDSIDSVFLYTFFKNYNVYMDHCDRNSGDRHVLDVSNYILSLASSFSEMPNLYVKAIKHLYLGELLGPPFSRTELHDHAQEVSEHMINYSTKIKSSKNVHNKLWATKVLNSKLSREPMLFMPNSVLLERVLWILYMAKDSDFSHSLEGLLKKINKKISDVAFY